MGDRVDMRAEQKRRQLLRACAPAENVPGRIDANVETCILHQACHIGPRIQIGLRKAEARDTAFGIAAKRAQFLQRRLQPLRVDMPRLSSRVFRPRVAGAEQKRTHER